MTHLGLDPADSSADNRCASGLDARIRGNLDQAPSKIQVSVIVPVRNEASCIRRTLTPLLEQRFDPSRFEILVVDGRSTDSTRSIVTELQDRFPNLRLLDNPKQWSSAGRNVGVRAARGEWLVVVDGHADVESPTYLQDIVDSFERSGADCLGRPQPLNVEGASPFQRAVAVARASWLGHHPASFIYSDQPGFVPPQSVAVAYRRDVFETVGMFDESFDACEDVEFNHRVDRAGLRCYFSGALRVRYHPRGNLKDLVRQLCRYGQGRMRLLWKHPRTLSATCLAPAVLVGAMAFGAVASLVLPNLAVPYAAFLAAYMVTLVATSAFLAWRHREMRLFPRLIAAYAAIHCGAGAGLLLEGFRQIRRRPSAPPTEPSPLPARYLLSSASPLDPPRAEPQRVLNALTIDVEDYFQVTGFERSIPREQWSHYPLRVEIGTDRILNALADASVRATFFVLGWVADRQPRLIRKIRDAGHEIGCHSYWHQLVYRQSPDEFRADLRRARRAIEDAAGVSVTAYRAPCYSVTAACLWALDVLIDEGFTLDSSIYPTHHDRYGIPGADTQPHAITRPNGTLWEFPMAIYSVAGYPLPIGGGGYFRLYPYAFTRHGLRSINAANKPFVVYLHPWEFDIGQPRLDAGRLASFRHYVNLHRTEERLRRLLKDFAFGALSDVRSRCDTGTSLGSRSRAA